MDKCLKKDECVNIQCVLQQTAGAPPGGHVTADTLISAVDVQQLVAREVEKMKEELMKTVSGLEAQVSNLSARLAVLENKRQYLTAGIFFTLSHFFTAHNQYRYMYVFSFVHMIY